MSTGAQGQQHNFLVPGVFALLFHLPNKNKPKPMEAYHMTIQLPQSPRSEALIKYGLITPMYSRLRIQNALEFFPGGYTL